jgi:acyl-CoA synthetase (AMP-forming)/AMP-acid ligase II
MLNLGECLESHARNRPLHPAVIQGDRTLTHAAFAGLVRRVEAALLADRLRQGDLVGVALEDTPLHLAALYALARRGMVAVPMDCRWTAAEKENLARHFGCARTLVSPGDAPAVPCLTVEEATLPAPLAAPPVPPAPEGLPLLLSLSSGTTGRPKGPMVTHAQVFRRFLTHYIHLGFGAEERFLSATPLYFGGGRTFCMSILYAGGTVILRPPPYRPEELLDATARSAPTILFLVPTLLRRLLALGEAAPPLAGLRLLISSGAPLSGAERARIRARLCPNLAEYYASTEGGGVSLLRPEEQDAHGATVGRPIHGVEVEIVDEDHRPLPPGRVGRLRYRGPGVATGYFRDPEASAEAFRDGWFYPGDLAERDEAGFISLRGRKKDMILRGGVNIYPLEIETCLMAHPDVADAAVVPAPSEEFGEIVVAHVVGGADPAALRAWCAARLAPYKVPARFVVHAELPRNSSGKVLKQALR